MIAVLVDAGSLTPGTTLLLPQSEIHHLKVRRVAVDTSLLLLDGHGARAEGIWKGGGTVEVQTVSQDARPIPLTLAVGAGDRDRFGWMIEKATELGVTDVIPLETDRTAGVSTRVRAGNVERLQRRGLEAIKQSHAAWAPVVHLPHSLPELLVSHADGVRWLADLNGERPLVGGPAPDLIIIGPEGGLTVAERHLLLESGIRLVRLGRYVLRFETAAVAAVAVAFQLREAGHHV